jgi:hypothetical protein
MQTAITLNTCRTVRKFWHNGGQEVLVREIELFWEQLNCCGVRGKWMMMMMKFVY